MEDLKKIILVLSFPLVIGSIAIVVFAGYNLITFTMLDEYNVQNFFIVVTSCFFWGLIGTFIILFLWLPYFFTVLIKEAFGTIAQALSDRSTRAEKSEKVKKVDSVIYENIYKMLGPLFGSFKFIWILWVFCMIGGVVGILTYLSLHEIQVLLHNIVGILYYQSSNSYLVWIPIIVFGGINSTGLTDYIMSLRKGSRSESIGTRTLDIYQFIKIILKILTIILIVIIIAIFIINKLQPSLVLEIPTLVSSLLLNVTILLSVWMLSYYLSRDFKFYLARACFLQISKMEINEKGKISEKEKAELVSKNDVKEDQLLWSGLGYYNEYLERNFGLKYTRLEFLNVIYKEEQKTPKQSSIRTKLYESFGIDENINPSKMEPLRHIVTSLQDSCLSEVNSWEFYKDLLTTIAIPIISTVISFLQLALQPAK